MNGNIALSLRITSKAPFQITKIFIKSIFYIRSKILSDSIYRYASEFTLYAHINSLYSIQKKRYGVLNPYIKTPNHKLFSLQFGVLFVYIRFGLVTN